MILGQVNLKIQRKFYQNFLQQKIILTLTSFCAQRHTPLKQCVLILSECVPWFLETLLIF